MNRQPYYYDWRETGRLTLKKALVVAVFVLVGVLIFLAACQWANARADNKHPKVPYVRHF